MTDLERLFDRTVWDRKFENQIPSAPLIVYREHEIAFAKRFLRGHREITRRVVRSLWLFSDSLGQGLAIQEEPA